MADQTSQQPEPPGSDAAEQPAGDASAPPEPEWQRRRRLAAVFGDVLPETTSDERDPDAADSEAAGERWLRAQVPPHHG
jgi:hypothetical protein